MQKQQIKSIPLNTFNKAINLLDQQNFNLKEKSTLIHFNQNNNTKTVMKNKNKTTKILIKNQEVRKIPQKDYETYQLLWLR
jgi:hypothetical protein